MPERPSTATLQDRSPDSLRLEVRRALRSLRINTWSLWFLGVVAFWVTLLNLAATVLYLVRGHTELFDVGFLGYPEETLFVVLLLSTAGVVVTATYDRRRRKGNVLFEEISDELEWNVRARAADDSQDNRGPESPGRRETPGLKVRVTLRAFARTTDLPLAPGAFGPGIYALINIGIALLCLAVTWTSVGRP